MLGEYKCLFILDLENRLVASGNPHNMISLEIFSKRLRTFKIKISQCDSKFGYSVFEKNYHEIKYWLYENSGINVESIRLKDFNRNIKDDPLYAAEYANAATPVPQCSPDHEKIDCGGCVPK